MFVCLGGVLGAGGGFRVTEEAEDVEEQGALTECCCILSMSWRFILWMQTVLAAVLISPIVYR